jgi:YD repeat-containing protein
VLHLPAEEGQQRQISFEHDESGRIVSETDVLGRTTTTRYHRNSLRPEAVQLPDGSRWQAEYDYTGRLLKTTDPLGREERSSTPRFRQSPRPVARIDAKCGRKALHWNRTGQLSAYTDCSGKTSRFEYDAQGLLVTHHDRAGHSRRWQRNARGQVVQATDAAGRQLGYRYDPQGLPGGTGQRRLR